MLEKELTEIVLKEKDIIPFLQSLNDKDKRSLVPFIKKFRKKINETYIVEEKAGWGTYNKNEFKYSEKKRDLVDMACFVCFNKTDIKRAIFNIANLSVSDEYLKKIIPWYVPKWFEEVVNKGNPWELNYDKMMQLFKQGLINPSNGLIIRRLPIWIIERKWENNIADLYKPERLLKYEETLKDHIWLLFEEDSEINNQYAYLNTGNHTGGRDLWIETIISLVTEKRLDRQRVLIATIYTSTKGFNKSLSGWFFDLLIKLNPSIEEILSLQDELFSVLNSPHSKLINTVLKYFKQLASNEKFKFKAFIDNSSIILNSETKSVVNSTLMILDKIAKTHETIRVEICIKASEALINLDEKIQSRAAKLIVKYGDPQNSTITDEVSLYTDNLFHSTKELLKDYSNFEEEVQETEHYAESLKILSEENKITELESLDDLIFFVSQSIDNNEVYHIDLLLSYLPKLNLLLNSDNVSKLEPVFKRALDLSMFRNSNSQIGQLESDAAFYINDFAKLLLKKYPDKLSDFNKYRDTKIQNLLETGYDKTSIKLSLEEIEKHPIHDFIYHIHYSLFVKSKILIRKNLSVGFLCTPTHEPCWIDPEILLNRIIKYENSSESIDLYDFQLAFGRMPLYPDNKEFISKIDLIKDLEIRNIFKYHFDEINIRSVKINRPDLWLQSVLSKNNEDEINYFQDQFNYKLIKESGQYNWTCQLGDYIFKSYDHSKRKLVDKTGTKIELRFKDFYTEEVKKKSVVSSIAGVFRKKRMPNKISSIYEYMHFDISKYYVVIWDNDETKFLNLSPNNPSSFLSHVIHHNLKESTFFDETGKKNMTNLLKGLYEIWYRADYKESTYLFLACGLLCSEKVARELAGELWIKANSENNMNNVILGKTIGKLQYGPYAPFKRFTDLISANLFNVSKLHNNSLLIVINNMFSEMNETPIRGLKKLLELYHELLLKFPETKLNNRSKEKFGKWSETKSLKPVIQKILNISLKNEGS